MLKQPSHLRLSILMVVAALTVAAGGCRRDMQDQPYYRAYNESDFFKNGIGSRKPPKNTVPRDYLREDTHLYAGKMQNNQSGAGGGGGGVQRSQQGAGSGSANQSFGAQSGQDTRQTGGLAAQQRTNTQRPSDTPQPTGSSAAQTPAQFDANLATTFPFQITKEDLDRGQQRFVALCSMCHGETGIGDGMVVRRGFRKPSSYHEQRLRDAPVGHFFDVITNGYGSMPSYAAQINPRDRWLIIAYIRALQLSQQASANDVPEASAKIQAAEGQAR